MTYTELLRNFDRILDKLENANPGPKQLKQIETELYQIHDQAIGTYSDLEEAFDTRCQEYYEELRSIIEEMQEGNS